jgi:initiation factor 1A
MVKNATGGNKAKGFARKGFVKGNNGLRVSEEEDEIYAQVTKVLGGAMCHVESIDGQKMLCHIRGKFRGRGKRDNFIATGSWLLIGLREWESNLAKDKLPNCDIIEVYNETDKNRLKNSVTCINWNKFIANDTKIMGDNTQYEEGNVSFKFEDEKAQEYRLLVESQLLPSNTSSTVDNFEEVNFEEVNFEDI